MSRNRDFQRKQNDTRMPVRESHADDVRMTQPGEPDFDLRRARDGPAAVPSRNRRYVVQAENRQATESGTQDAVVSFADRQEQTDTHYDRQEDARLSHIRADDDGHPNSDHLHSSSDGCGEPNAPTQQRLSSEIP